MLFFLYVTRALPIVHNVDPHFVTHAPFLTRLTYAFFSIQAARPKFYFAWTLGMQCVYQMSKTQASLLLLCMSCFGLIFSVLSADAVNNAAGYGFLGIDETGKPSWDLVCNLNILGIEVISVFHIIKKK